MRQCTIIYAHLILLFISISSVICFLRAKGTLSKTLQSIQLRAKPELQSKVNIFNTLSKRKELFIPLDPQRVTFYSCGPTLYDYAHIGNYRAFITYDIVKRWLQYCGYNVDHVCNLTDIDDKIINKMLLTGKSRHEIVNKYEKSFYEDLNLLNIIPARAYPRVSEHIHDINHMITKLIQSKHAYIRENSIYYNVSSFPTYGELINKNRLKAEKKEFSRTLQKSTEEKEHEEDFALWKFVRESENTATDDATDIGVPAENKSTTGSSSNSIGEVCWDSSYGPGRPGWHIECSAMCQCLLGDSIDLHAGGADLAFPHHSNEIAQSEAYTGKKLSRYWLHNGFVRVQAAKMSKSLCNFQTLRDISQNPEDARVYRYMVVASQYRKDLSYSEEAFEGARRSLARIDRAVQRLEKQLAISAGSCIDSSASTTTTISETINATIATTLRQEFTDKKEAEWKQFLETILAAFECAMCDDLNTPKAIAVLFQLISHIESHFTITETPVPVIQYILDTFWKMNAILGISYTVPVRTSSDTTTEDTITTQGTAVTSTSTANTAIDKNIKLLKAHQQATILAKERMKLKTEKKYEEADKLREDIAQLGYLIRDNQQGGYELILS